MSKLPETTTRISDNNIERTTVRVFDDDGKLYRIMEFYHDLNVEYKQTIIKDANGHTHNWLDSNGEYEAFHWYTVPDKKGNPVWVSEIIHSTIKQIKNGKKNK